jgi:hypothetical protein
MPTAIVMSLSYCKANNTIRAATHGRGVYERTALTPPTNVAENSSAEPSSFSVFPTVLSESSNRITIAIPPKMNNQQWSSLILCDRTGKIIQKIAGGQELNARVTTSFAINSRSLADGMYYLELESETNAIAKKLLVIK